MGKDYITAAYALFRHQHLDLVKVFGAGFVSKVLLVLTSLNLHG